MRKSTTLLLWLLGISIVLSLLTIFVLRYPGYILYFDSSGSFSFRRPFDQYLFTYTPYDGVEAGIKNRLPIVSVIVGIYYFLRLFFPLTSQDVIKIAFVLLFVGAYTAYFYVIPKIYRLITRANEAVDINPILRVVLPFLYLLVPFFVFRQSMVHMFYLTTFYPLISYQYLELLEQKSVSYRQIYILVLLCFFGFSYTNILYFYIVTFLLLGLTYTVKHYREKTLKNFLQNLLGAGILIVITNLYWVVPYFLKGAPTPGYVVTDMMLKVLGDKNTFMNVFFDSSEWFYDSVKGISIFIQDNQLVYALQVAGAVNLYVFAFIAAIKSKNKYVTTALVSLVVGTFVLISKESPVYKALYDGFVYLNFGWLIREPNRLRFFIAFWIFILFSVGIILSFVKPHSVNTKIDSQSADLHIYSYVALILFCFYSVPWAYKSLAILKPTVISTELQSVNNQMAGDNEYAYVFHAPSFEWYRASWNKEIFPLVDNLHYQKIIPYGLSRPSANLSTVIPTTRQKESYLMEMLFFTGQEEKQSAVMKSFGIKHILFDNKAVPLFISEKDNNTYYLENMHKLWRGGDNFTTVHKGIEYELLQVGNFSDSDSFSFQSDRLVTAEPLSQLTKVSTKSLENNTITLKNYDTDELTLTDKVITTQANNYPYLDYLSKSNRIKYVTYPFDALKAYGVLLNWGKMSPMDKGSAEMSAIFRYHSIRVFQYLEDDKVAYSDYSTEHKNAVSEMSYEYSNDCLQNCAVFAKVLYSAKGGNLTVQVGNYAKTVSTSSDKSEGFYWTQVARNVSFSTKSKTIQLKNTVGFSALGGIMVIPESEVADLQSTFAKKTVITIPDDATNFDLPTIDPGCSVDETSYNDRGFISTVSVKGYCADSVNMKLKAFQSEFLYYNKNTKKMAFMSSVPVRGSFDGDIYFVSHVDVVLWAMFLVTYAGVISMALAVVLRVVR